VIVLAGRRAEVDRLNSACQHLLAGRGRLGPGRLQVEDLQLGVGDRVMCGRNAITQLGVANGTRGTIIAVDPQARTLTIHLDGKDAHLGPAYRRVVRELAWQGRARGLAPDHDQPGYLRDELGPLPESTRGRRTWRQAAAIEDYRQTYGITDPEAAIGPVPREPAPRAAWQHARQAISRVQARQRSRDHDRPPQRAAASRPPVIDRHHQDKAAARSELVLPPRRPGPERAAG
jgi:hypothetical protein